MSSAAFIVTRVLPYLALGAFLLGVAYRLLTWRRVPQPALMTLYPRQGSGWKPLVKEALFFPGLFRGDKALWSFAWCFHAALALAFLGHLRVVTGLVDDAAALVGLHAGAMATLSSVAGRFAGLVLLATILLLLGRRVLLRRVREVSSVPDFFALFLLVAVIATGDLMRFGGGSVDLAATRAWALALPTLAPAPALPTALLLHLFCAELLVLHLAFSKLMHFGGFFFTFSLVKRSAP
jgi:nitrate reductase gamma subunit